MNAARRAFHGWIFRWGSPGVPFLAFTFLEHAVVLLLRPETFSGPTYRSIFAVAPERVWGVLLLVVSLLGLFVRRDWVYGLILFAAMAWGGLIFRAVMLSEAGSLIGWAWPLNFAAATYFGTRRRGIHGR